MINSPEELQMQVKTIRPVLQSKKNSNTSFGINIKNESLIPILLKQGASSEQLEKVASYKPGRTSFFATLTSEDDAVLISIQHPRRPSKEVVKRCKTIGQALNFLERPKKLAGLWAKSKDGDVVTV